MILTIALYIPCIIIVLREQEQWCLRAGPMLSKPSSCSTVRFNDIYAPMWRCRCILLLHANVYICVYTYVFMYLYMHVCIWIVGQTLDGSPMRVALVEVAEHVHVSSFSNYHIYARVFIWMYPISYISYMYIYVYICCIYVHM
jgi:hypothetical protein